MNGTSNFVPKKSKFLFLYVNISCRLGLNVPLLFYFCVIWGTWASQRTQKIKFHDKILKTSFIFKAVIFLFEEARMRSILEGRFHNMDCLFKFFNIVFRLVFLISWLSLKFVSLRFLLYLEVRNFNFSPTVFRLL